MYTIHDPQTPDPIVVVVQTKRYLCNHALLLRSFHVSFAGRCGACVLCSNDRPGMYAGIQAYKQDGKRAGNIPLLPLYLPTHLLHLPVRTNEQNQTCTTAQLITKQTSHDRAYNSQLTTNKSPRYTDTAHTQTLSFAHPLTHSLTVQRPHSSSSVGVQLLPFVHARRASSE